MDTAELRATALAQLIDRGIDPRRLLQREEIEQLRRTFTELDLDGNGKITKDELRRSLHDGISEPSVTEERVQRVLDLNDINGDGQLTFDELVTTCMLRHVKDLEEHAWHFYARLDLDAEGRVRRSAIPRMALANTTLPGTGRKIDYAEFLTWYVSQKRT